MEIHELLVSMSGSTQKYSEGTIGEYLRQRTIRFSLNS